MRKMEKAPKSNNDQLERGKTPRNPAKTNSLTKGVRYYCSSEVNTMEYLSRDFSDQELLKYRSVSIQKTEPIRHFYNFQFSYY